MRLSDLEGLPTFALLGPGFGGGRFILLTELRETSHSDAMIAFASFETAGIRALRLTAGSARACDVVCDAMPHGVHVDLRAEDHARNVVRIREAIAAGDVYQVCLTVRAHVSVQSGAELMSLMCAPDAPRFAAWLRLPNGLEFVSASPELFFEIDHGYVHAEPMKGTARRGAGGRLEASDKDRCELAMITDLLRNDLAQVCRPRSVRVARERRILELPYALQTVSDVVGVLKPHVTPLDVLAALHPGGSVTGAPKQAALAMIPSLEPGPRGAYCGALGLLTGARSIFSMLIRTAVKTSEGWVYGVGGGIVFDSDPQAEFDELHVKLGALRCPTLSCV